MKTVVGLFDDLNDAQAAVTDLVQAGFDRSDISLVATDRWGEQGTTGVPADTGAGVYSSTSTGYTDTTTTGMTGATGTGDQVASDVAAGAVTGGVVGGLAGVLLGLGVLAIPGFGPVLAAGPLVAGLAGAGIGAAVGGLVGALVSWGVPQDEAELYAESIRRGSILVGLKTDESRVQQAVNIMNNHGPVDVQRRSEYWRAEGWSGYDPSSVAWSGEQIDTDRRRYSDYLDYASYTPAYREHWQETYGNSGRDFAIYDPAYRYGYSLAQDDRYRNYSTWDELEADARSGWEQGENATVGAWNDFKDAVRRGWEQVKDALDLESDYADFETGYRQHWQDSYGNSGHDYDWYGPAYRYGYNLAMDERWDQYETWEDLEAEARRGWEGRPATGILGAGETGGGTWEDFKDAIRRGWEDVKDAFDAEDDYYSFTPSFREHWETTYGDTSRDFDYYDPAYRYGYNLAIDDRYADVDNWDDLERDAREGWSNFAEGVEGTWEEFKDAVRRGWEEVRDALDMEEDYAAREPGYREHYDRLYRNNLRNYEWYEPAYRYGYIMGMDDRYADAASWDEIESRVHSDWEASDYYTEDSPWDDIKDAVRQGWESVREALDMDDDSEQLRADSGGYSRN